MSAILGCSSGYQCLSAAANQTVCVPAVWRCDKMYHCIDGQDELSKWWAQLSNSFIKLFNSQKNPYLHMYIIFIMIGVIYDMSTV